MDRRNDGRRSGRGRTRRTVSALSSLAVALGLLIGTPMVAQADSISRAVPPGSAVVTSSGGLAAMQNGPMNVSHDRVVSAVPAAWTPQVLNGAVYDIAQVGNTMVVGGSFSTIAPSGGSPTLNRANLFAFNATTGAINTSFAPSVGGAVNVVEPGPGSTVYIGGAFQGVDGVTGRVFQLDVNTGEIVSTFTPPPMNGMIRGLVRHGDRLYVGGNFQSVGGVAHGGLVSLDATTGARQDFVNIHFTENHNWTGGSGARGALGPRSMAITPDGSQLAVIGNFRKVNDLDRRQMVLIDLTGDQAQVREDWRTRRYDAACFSWAFDTYVRDVDVAPDGSYFTVATTGGPNPGTLCDTLTRWDVADSGQSVEPVWIDDTGGDTLLSVASSGAAIYTGGHQRWHNNHGGRDFPAPGAVGRAGLAAVDQNNGLPLSWNPGRSPRGVGAEAAYVTDAGLWIGSDTEQIGHHQYRRPRLAFFPVAGGQAQGPGETGVLPSNVYVASDMGTTAEAGEVLFRVNAGGPALPALDDGPEWSGDEGTTSPWRTSGSNAAPWPTVPATDGTVPATTPSAVFDSERWDPPDAPAMNWAIPIPAGQEILVRLYLANRCTCTEQVGQRIFDVELEGQTVLSGHDMVADSGHDVGTMKQYPITSDGVVNIDFRHVVENPLINGIEIVERLDSEDPDPQGTGLSRVWYGGGHVVEEPQPAPVGDLDWEAVRGATVIDGELFYGLSNGTFWRRTFDGTDYGTAAEIDPYNDPYWSNINTGSGGYTYRGVQPNFYNQIASITGMAYEDGRLYYTRAGQNRLYSRAFLPESGILTQAVQEVEGFTPSNLGGVFFDPGGGFLFYSNSANGNLSRIGWADGTVQGEATVVSGPDLDGMDWRGRALFLAEGPAPAENEPPQAVIEAECFRMDCVFDGTESSDSDGSVVSYLWDFGDGTTSTDAEASHTYAEEDTYTVTLTVTDDDGAIGTDTYEVEAFGNRDPVAVIADPMCVGLECSFDGSESSDPDTGDSIESFVWDFGDGSSSVAGESVSHEFSEPGSYTVTLTVTDSEGAEGTESITIEVTEVQGPELVGHAEFNGHSSVPGVSVPVGVEAGDLMVLFVALGTAHDGLAPTGVGDWDEAARVPSGPLAVSVFTRVADGSEAGQHVSVAMPALTKVSAVLTAYRGADSIEVLESATAAGTSTHTTPSVEVAGDHRTVLSYWAERSSATTAWVAPDAVSVISSLTGVGGGRVGSLLGEAHPGPGTFGALVAQTDANSGRSATLTLALADAAGGGGEEPPENQPPVAVIADPACVGLECVFGGSASSDPDEGDSIESFAWDFGDDSQGATGESVTHRFTEPGTYTVTLTVTDTHGAMGSDSIEVELSDETDPGPGGAVEFVGHEEFNGHTSSPRIAVPSEVEAGDILVLFVTLASDHQGVVPSGVGDWDDAARVTSGPLVVSVHTRIAEGSEAGQQVTLTVPSMTKVSLVMAAYRGAESIEALEWSTGLSTAVHTTPTVAVAGEGRTVLSFWAERSSATTSWAPPDGVSVISSQTGVGGGRVGSLLAQDQPGGGDYGALVAQTDSVSARSATLTLVLGGEP